MAKTTDLYAMVAHKDGSRTSGLGRHVAMLELDNSGSEPGYLHEVVVTMLGGQTKTFRFDNLKAAQDLYAEVQAAMAAAGRAG